MRTFKIVGLRGSKQADRLQEELKQLTDNIQVNPEDQTLSISDEVDMSDVLTITSFEQLSLKSPDKDREDHSHDHQDHHHGHGHSHHIDGNQMAERNIFIVFLINITFAVAEFIFGSLFNSSAIMADAVHDLGDAVSVGLAWFFQRISTHTADDNYSYGYGRFSLLGAFVTSVVLIGGSILMIINSVPQLFEPEPVNYSGMFWLAIAAILANGFAAWLLSRGSTANESVLNLHMLEDVLGWVGVLVVSIVLRFTDWYILDPILSILIASWILLQTWPQFVRVARIFLQAVPEEVDMHALKEEIEAIQDVTSLSHLHVWSTDGQEHMLTVTVTTQSDSLRNYEHIKQAIRQVVVKDEISHATIEIIHDPKHLIKHSIQCSN